MKLFSTTDIRKAFPSFDARRLVEWQHKGYIHKIINRWYKFSDVPTEERLMLWTANRIYHPSYVSMETALSYYGLIPEAVYTITAVSTLKTKSLIHLWVLFLTATLSLPYFSDIGFWTGKASR